MRAILLNDTRSDHHIGCELVVRNSLELCKQHGINVTSTITTSNALEAPDRIEPMLSKNDLVLLNGEGTLHHDRPRALALLEAASLAKKSGLKTVLYNALWSENPEGATHLPHFDLIFCRDSQSADEILRHHPALPVQTVPDMIFATPVPDQAAARTSRPLVTDSVKKKKSIALAKFAHAHRFPFAPMGSGFFRQIQSSHLLKWHLARRCGYHHNKLDTPEAYMQKILTSSGVITGRFHTACLAILLQTPVFCISSNTQKIQTLYSDLGLSPELIPDSISSPDTPHKQWQEQEHLRSDLQSYTHQSRERISSMFHQISNL